MALQPLELNGGYVLQGPTHRLVLPAGVTGYADAQLDDYRGRRRSHYLWRPGTTLTLQARFSHPANELHGTAGFGFWNAPFGDPTVRWPALPRAVWFFFASEPSDLPLRREGHGRGWFVSTIDAAGPAALALAPFAPLVLLLNQVRALRRLVWPWIRRKLKISFHPLELDMTVWHEYGLDWLPEGCRFWVDGADVAHTLFRPRGPLGFVCWMDNQHLVATPGGRFAWGVLQPPESQWLEVRGLRLATISVGKEALHLRA
jgi:hypothetical protein